ncbi:NADPH:quinone reductase-like Zn-dependent oxidoreductase [Nitrospirillum amazonense]|uniref:NADPH:quinone reductase-like Zn-dependent oxidoreductase n=1 Tax=Nitrospirillum amazonense TaxID=28077 RepID=A0A560FFF1_9PROT|nr:NADP-dependent oxidoreductase [Nitrospirillum amazonense]TWB20335.1 NADPH:quinone reductase-like Zn-dependent oxidoreductase [Nitrospirillum amazonense]
MKAFRIHGYAADPVIDTVDMPRPGAGEVLVRVAAASLNPLDVKLQRGYMEAFFPLAFPYTLGSDLSGTIEALGDGVSGWSAGDRVVARTAPTSGGALAEFAVVPADQLVRLADTVSFERAAGAPTAAGTAWQALFEVAGLGAGRTVLIHAGAGGVGSFAIQFARQAGARVVATASGNGIAIAERLGADLVIDYRNQDFTKRVSDVDVVLDTIGGETQARSYELLRAGGFLASIAAPPDGAFAKAHGVEAAFVFHRSDAARLAAVMDKVAAGVEVLIDRTVPGRDAVTAFHHQASGRARGKIVLTNGW